MGLHHRSRPGVQMGPVFRRVVSAAVATVLASSFLVALPHVAVGAATSFPTVLDQSLSGNPPCDQGHFPGRALLSAPLRQEFVPSRAGLTRVSLCIQAVIGATITLKVEGPGTASAPGNLIESVQATAPTGLFDYLDFDLPKIETTSPGSKYVLELSSIPSNIYWRFDCGTTLSACPSTATDQYPAGGTNVANTIGAKADFGFRTYTPDAADLTGSISSQAVACEGKSIPNVKASVTNTSSYGVGPFSVGFYLSPDSTITKSDTVLGHVSVPSLAANTTLRSDSSPPTLTLPTLTIPSTWKEGPAYLGIIVDENNTVVETDDTTPTNNNAQASALAVFCGHAGFSSIGLTSDQTTIPAGSYRVPVDSIPLDAIGFAATGTEDAGMRNSGMRNSGLRNSGMRNSPLIQALAGAPASALSAIHLSDIPIFIQGGWTALLQNTTLATEPLQDVTLGQYLALPNPPAVTIGDLDLENSPLRVITFAGVGTAGVSLNNLGTQVGSPPQDWCTFLAGEGYSCQTYGIDPASSTLLDLNLLGVAATIPWNTLPFRQMVLSGSPLYAIKLTSFAIRNTPARDFPLSALNSPSTFTTCSPSTCATLGDAEAKGTIVDGPTFGDLIGNLKTPATTLGSTTLGDYLMGAMPDRDEWPVGALGLGRANQYSPTNLPVTYHATLTATSGSGTAPLVNPQITIKMPPGFVVSGPATVNYPAGTQTQIAKPSSVAGSTVTWTLPNIVTQGTTAEVVFNAMPGLDLGSVGSNVSAHAVDEFGDVNATALTNQAIVKVIDTDTISGQQNDTATTAPYLESRVRRLGYISSSSDTDFYRIPVPTGPGCTLDPTSTAASPGGCTIEILMAPQINDGSDFDLVLYGPQDDPVSIGMRNSGMRNSGMRNSPLQDDPSAGATTTDVPPETLADIGMRNSGLRNSSVRDFSVQRGTSNEVVRTTTVGGEKGFFVLQVSGYNGQTSTHPYVLTTYSAPPPALAPCTPRNYNNGSYTATAPTIPSDFTTLIVVDENRMAKMFGTSALAGSGGLLDHLNTLAQRTNGVVFPVDTNTDYESAIAAWDGNPCDVGLANAASTKLAKLIQNTVANKPSFKYVVIVGTDDAIPSFRMADGTSVANEVNYVDSLVAAENNTSITSVAAASNYLTDDIYATDEWLDTNSRPLLVAKWSVGRLIETPQDINGQIDAFVASNGQAEQPPNQTALVTGYDFLADGATAAANSEAATLGADKVTRLICETWTRQDLLNNLAGAGTTACGSPGATSPPDIIGLNGHADNYRFLTAAGNASGTDNDLATSADVGSLPPGRIIFSMGCHFGLNLPDSAVAPADANAARLNDWPQALAKRNAVVVANSGYGYGDTEAIAYSERLMANFAQGLDGTRSVGEAFRDAKQSYYLANFGTYGPYDEKALQEAILYGLPMFTTASTPAIQPNQQPAPTQSVATSSLSQDPTGLLTRPFDSGQLSFSPTTTSSGTYYSANGDLLIKNRRPIVPQVQYDATNTDPNYPGYKAIGLFPTSQDTSVVSGNNPVFGTAEYSTDRPEQQSSGVFPTSPGAITTLDNTQRLLLWPARFTPTSAAGAPTVTGDLALRNRVKGLLYYSNVDGALPQILQVIVQAPDQTHLSFQVLTSSPDADVKRVGVLVGAAFGDLAQSGPNLWTGTVTVADSSQRSDVLVSAVAATGIGYWADKGTPIKIVSSTQGLTINVCPNGTSACTTDGTTTNGWFNTPLRSDVTGSVPTQAIDVSVDGQPSSNPAQITQTGVHTISAQAYDSSTDQTYSASRTVLLDVSPPTAVITSPSGTYEFGTPVSPSYSCSDAGSGIQTCQGPTTVDTSLGNHTYTVTVTDLAGNTRTVSSTYTVRDTVPPTITITSPTARTYEQGTVVNAAFSCSDGNGSGVTMCSGSVNNGDPINMSPGTHTFTVNAQDAAGNPATSSVTYTVADTQAPSITITTPVNNATYALNTSLKASYTCSDSGSGVATCSGSVNGTPVANGGTIDTSKSGTYTFTVTSTDNAGNSASKSVTYKVALQFKGFYSPVSNPPTLNKLSSGNTEPFKFQVFNNGTEITSTTGFSFAWQTISCSTKAPITPDPFTQTATSNPVFRYDTQAKQFVFNAVTDKSWAGSCRQFTVTLPDGSTQFAYVQLT